MSVSLSGLYWPPVNPGPTADCAGGFSRRAFLPRRIVILPWANDNANIYVIVAASGISDIAGGALTLNKVTPGSISSGLRSVIAD